MSGVLHGLLAAVGQRQPDYSVYFDGTGDSLSVSGSGFNISTGDFTAECWFHYSGPFFYDVVFSSTAAYQTTNNLRLITNASENKLIFANHGGAFLAASSTFVTGVWNHVAVVRSGSTLTLYQNGVSVGSTTYSGAVASDTFYIANAPGDGNDYSPNGYISNFRVVKSAVYTANFTPPTARLGAVANTVLLTCQDATIKDNSGNNLTVTANGNAAVNGFDPFEPDYSVYFDGSGDYLTVPSNSAFDFGTGDFCVEAWIRPDTGLTGHWTIVGASGSGGLTLGHDGNLRWGRVGIGWDTTSNTTISTGVWSHVAMTRSGSSMKLFVNGQTVATATNTSSYNLSTTSLSVGGQGNSVVFKGYISNLRVLKGTALYTSNFTPPTSRLGAISGTSLLTCQDSTFKDNSSNNFTVTANGNAAVNGFDPFEPDYSVYFDGSGDYLSVSGATSSNFPQSGAYTIEAWVYPLTISQGHIIGWGSSSTNLANRLRLFGSEAGYTNGVVNYWWGNDLYTSTNNVIATNQWHHVAATFDGSTHSIYVNGSRVGTRSATFSGANPSNITIGGNMGSTDFHGYISNVRVSNVALYSGASFTVPSGRLSATSSTKLLTCQDSTFKDNSSNNLTVAAVGNAAVNGLDPFS